MEASTYSLKRGQENSDAYYKCVKKFTEEIINEFENYETSVITDFTSYLKEEDSTKIRSYEEYLFEVLMLGTFWKVYGARAVNLEENPQKILENLVNKRKENETAKKTIDLIRGLLMKPFLLSEEDDTPDLTLENFKKLLAYLKAVGDFEYELKHLEIWKDFFETKNPETVSEYLTTAFLFADRFEYWSKVVLGKYTDNVNKFLDERYSEHHWKEDVIFCGRREVEYHMNMVGAEIMNMSFKKDFHARPRKALVLPGCMRISPQTCKAEETDLGLKCKGCIKDCNVNNLRILGNKYGFEVYIVLHESSAFSKSSKKDRDELGIIGVACISNLIAGGWKSESLGMPAQCVLLDYSSCKNHWDNEGFPTTININQLMRLFNRKFDVKDNFIKNKGKMGGN